MVRINFLICFVKANKKSFFNGPPFQLAVSIVSAKRSPSRDNDKIINFVIVATSSASFTIRGILLGF